MVSKTLVLVKSRVLKYRPRLKNRTSITQTSGLILQIYHRVLLNLGLNLFMILAIEGNYNVIKLFAYVYKVLY